MNRKKEYNRRRIRNWLRFIRNVGPFAFGVIALAILIVYVMSFSRTDQELIYVGFNVPAEIKETEKNRRYFEPSTAIAMLGKSTKLWGGIETNSLVIYSELVADFREVTVKNKTFNEPIVCLPPNLESYKKALFDEAIDEKYWTGFFSYVNDVVDQVSKQNHGGRKHLLLAFDIHLPDGPGGIPPQLNPFIRLVKEEWESKVTVPDEISLTCWLSHDVGQRNYLHSNSQHVGTHFKHVFEKAMFGQGVGANNNEEVTLEGLSSNNGRGICLAVEKSAARHDVIQTPVLLPVINVPNEAVKLYPRKENAKVGSLLGYNKRILPPEEINEWWDELNKKIKYRHWEIENPFDLQRASMLLLKYEQLWYWGFEPTSREQISKSLNSLFKGRTILPPMHSVYDAEIASRLDEEINFSQIATIDKIDEKSFYSNSEGESRAIDSWPIEGKKERAAYELWKFLVNATDLDYGLLQTVNEFVEEHQLSKPSSLPLNELVFLQRLANELPAKQFDNQQEIVIRDSIRSRDAVNKLWSNMSPVLASLFSEEFEILRIDDGLLKISCSGIGLII